MTLDHFVTATRVARAGGDVAKTLDRLGLTMDDYLRANRHFMQRMAKDEELAARFQRALR
jgi:hypothetical protein